MPSTKEIYDTITPKGAKKRFIAVILFGVIMLAITLFYVFFHDSKNITYTTIKPVQGDITQSVSATGTLSPTNEVEIGSQISGTIYKLYVDVNDSVRKNQILAEINPNKLNQTKEGYEAQLQSALANLEASKVALEQKKWNTNSNNNSMKQQRAKPPPSLNCKMQKWTISPQKLI